jgi:hypothetical protein
MKYPEAFLLPIMMFLDYFLTVLGAVWREKKYTQYFKIQHYELNPMWQRQIAGKQWFNLRHIALTSVLSGALICLLEFGHVPHGFAGGLLGSVLVLYGMILGRHLSNLLVFSYLVKNPDEISGEMIMSQRFVLFLSLYQSLMVMVPMALIAVFSQSDFVWGGIVGILIFQIIQLRWIQREKDKKLGT